MIWEKMSVLSNLLQFIISQTPTLHASYEGVGWMDLGLDFPDDTWETLKGIFQGRIETRKERLGNPSLRQNMAITVLGPMLKVW